MPRGDKTGPAGAGPMTGRGMGICADTLNPDFGRGRGCGRGIGRRRGFGARATLPISKAEQLTALKAQMEQIQQQIDSLEENA